MNKKTFALTALVCLAAVLFVSCFPLAVYGASENSGDLEILESMRNAQKTKASEDGTTYATIPHGGSSENGTFVTVFTVVFMIVLVVAGAVVMFCKR